MVYDTDVIHLPNGESFAVTDVHAASTGGNQAAAHGLRKALTRLGISMEEQIQFAMVEVRESYAFRGRMPRHLEAAARPLCLADPSNTRPCTYTT